MTNDLTEQYSVVGGLYSDKFPLCPTHLVIDVNGKQKVIKYNHETMKSLIIPTEKYYENGNKRK